jgi:hypothetical protein
MAANAESNSSASAVVGIKHPEFGEEVGAAVALKPGHKTDPDELKKSSAIGSRPTSTHARSGWWTPCPRGRPVKILRRAGDVSATQQLTSSAPASGAATAAAAPDITGSQTHSSCPSATSRRRPRRPGPGEERPDRRHVYCLPQCSMAASIGSSERPASVSEYS